MLIDIAVRTGKRSELVDITRDVRAALARLGAKSGVATVYSPHTTAGITINENADPDVRHDLVDALNRLVPADQPQFRHAEGNSDAHLKATLTGFSAQVPVEDGELCLGTWQAIYFCEFDGPRIRKIYINFLKS